MIYFTIMHINTALFKVSISKVARKIRNFDILIHISKIDRKVLRKMRINGINSPLNTLYFSFFSSLSSGEFS